MKTHRFYSNSLSAFDAMMAAVSIAKKSIYWESYIFVNDILPTHDFFAMFKQKAKSGIKVVIILDGLGSYGISKESLDELKKAGVEIRFFSSWLRRTHRKLLIIDDKVAFLGGVNIGQAYMKWFDLQVRVAGVILPALIHSFAKSYAMCGGEDLSVLRERNTQKTFRATKLWFIEHWPIFGKLKMREYYEEKIQSAKRSIVMVTPYFMPHKWMIKALLEAAHRGVVVEVMFPEHTDPLIADIPNYYNADRLSPYGVTFLITRKMNHAKALLIDDAEGMIGSQNIDAYSFDFNSEAAVSFTKKDMVRDLKKIITLWKKESVAFDKIMWKRKWYYPFMAFLVRLSQPFF